MSNFSIRSGGGALNFVTIDTADISVAAGGPGYVDTDVSATCGTNVNRVWAMVASTGAFTTSGARKHGAATAPTVINTMSTTHFACVDATGHMDLYQVAGAITHYYIFGYFEVA